MALDMQEIASRYTAAETARAENVNEVLRQLSEKETDTASEVQVRLLEIETATANVRRAIEQGLDDVGWANSRLRELTVEREKLENRQAGLLSARDVPKLDVST